MVKLLVVDDEKDVCDFTENFFKDRGFSVSCAYNGRDAISILEKEHPEIILLDVKMEGMDGITALKQIRQIAPSTMVIMVTAVDDIEKISQAKILGARDYVTKPLVLEELEKKVLSIAVEVESKK